MINNCHYILYNLLSLKSSENIPSFLTILLDINERDLSSTHKTKNISTYVPVSNEVFKIYTLIQNKFPDFFKIIRSKHISDNGPFEIIEIKSIFDYYSKPSDQQGGYTYKKNKNNDKGKVGKLQKISKKMIHRLEKTKLKKKTK